MSKWSAFKLFLAGWDALQNEPNFMLMRYSIVELLMVFEVSAQREHTTWITKFNSLGHKLTLVLVLNNYFKRFIILIHLDATWYQFLFLPIILKILLYLAALICTSKLFFFVYGITIVITVHHAVIVSFVCSRIISYQI